MKIGFVALLTALGALSSGCATAPEQQPAAVAGAAAPPATATNTAPSRMRRAAITGSRLQPFDDDDLGMSSVGAVSREDYMHDADTRTRPLRAPEGRGM